MVGESWTKTKSLIATQVCDTIHDNPTFSHNFTLAILLLVIYAGMSVVFMQRILDLSCFTYRYRYNGCFD
jgi:hypothetical protein